MSGVGAGWIVLVASLLTGCSDGARAPHLHAEASVLLRRTPTAGSARTASRFSMTIDLTWPELQRSAND